MYNSFNKSLSDAYSVRASISIPMIEEQEVRKVALTGELFKL